MEARLSEVQAAAVVITLTQAQMGSSQSKVGRRYMYLIYANCTYTIVRERGRSICMGLPCARGSLLR